jgi:DNA-binding FadR family transcriptional regulator
MVVTMIRHIPVRRDARSGTQVLGHDDADTAARYAGALLQYRDTTLADLYEARIHLEAAAVETLATKRSAGDLRRLDVAIAESEAALPDPIAYRAKHELQFHRLLIELAGNQTMIALADMLMSIIELHKRSLPRTHPVGEASEDDARAAHRAHAKVADLIRQKAAGQAVTFWGQHLHSIAELMISDPGETVLDILS